MLVHFPSALFPFELACSILAYYTSGNTFVFASFYAMSGGVLLGWVAVMCGTLDLLGVLKEKSSAIKSGFIHGSINTCVIIFYTVLAYSQYKMYPSLEADKESLLIIKASIIFIMFLGNYFGGSLILEHGVAVKREN